MKSGFIAVLGKPNVGKSSLINAILNQKVSIVSPKAQTTRDRVMGILTEEQHQIIFVDTPGIHVAKNALGRYMEKCVLEAEKDCDAVLLLFDASKSIIKLDELALINKYSAKFPVYIILNKIDLVGFDKVYPLIARINEYINQNNLTNVREIVPLSCKSKKNVDLLKDMLKGILTDENQYFDSEDLSDKPISYMVCEIVREKALWLLNDEIPHGIGVALVTMDESSTDSVIIEADIVCERDSHKQIIIGEDGSMIKKIGTLAREEIETLIGRRVYLKLFVKVRQNWRNRRSIIEDVGYKN